MVQWLSQNWGTILVSIILLCVVTLIIVKMVKDKKKGRSSCGSNCRHCAMCGSCHRKPESIG